jgi:hypothetical protein
MRGDLVEGPPPFLARSDLIESDTVLHTLPSEQTRTSGCGMTDKSDSSFAVVRFNGRTYQPGGVVAVVRGIRVAQRTLDNFDWCQSDENRRAGWRYFLEKTDLPPGMDPEKATTLRQVRFDLQEA